MQRRNISTHQPPPQQTQLVSDDSPSSQRDNTCSGKVDVTSTDLLTALVAFRVISAVLNQTSFVPDEYWQSLEVAHRMVFRYGYLTWEWKEAIRGYTHPLLYAVIYKTLAVLYMDYGWLLVELPKLLNSLLAVICDVYVFKLGCLLYGPTAGYLALLCNISSWFLFYCLPRSMTNSLETVLTAPLLFHWFKATDSLTVHQLRRRHTLLYLSLSAVAALVRPTAVILSVPLVVSHLYRRPAQWKMLVQYCTLTSAVVLVWSFSVDWYFYDKPVFVQWNFFVFNVLEGHSAAYGSHPWHWYLTQGAPVVLSTSLPLLFILLWLSHERSVVGLLLLGGWVVMAHSLLAHKEFRFIMPTLPIASILAGYALHLLFSHKRLRVLAWLSCVLMLVNVPAAVWFCLIHQRGTLDIMTYLRSNVSDDSSVFFLMPCHSTPFYSHIHRDISMEFLECPPQLNPGYIDMEGEFYSDPEGWLHRRYSTPPSCLPTHLILFDTLIPEIESFLKQHRYREASRLFHTLHPLEADMGTHIVVYIADPA